MALMNSLRPLRVMRNLLKIEAFPLLNLVFSAGLGTMKCTQPILWVWRGLPASRPCLALSFSSMVLTLPSLLGNTLCKDGGFYLPSS